MKAEQPEAVGGGKDGVHAAGLVSRVQCGGQLCNHRDLR